MGVVICVDPSDAEPIIAELKHRNWKLDYIFNTHHHYDHTDGNGDLKKATGAKVIGCEKDKLRIPYIDIAVTAGEILEYAGCEVLPLYGHTTGHIGFYFPQDKALFCGDVLFSLGCGRVFEGTYEQAYNSLQIIAKLPPDTRIYCGHEYTRMNSGFALKYEPNNPNLREYCENMKEPTIPTTVKLERKTNPFLRCDSVEIRYNLGLDETASKLEVFTELRKKRNVF